MNTKERAFQAFVLDWYQASGRHDLPWRQTTDPYAILVSELMLQQTQVVRVIPKYQAFLERFPTVHDLAEASLGDVLRLWQGLGYNRRAKFLHQCAEVVVHEYAGIFPQIEAELRQLPGIGPYTAAAVCAFAYNQPVHLIETNVRQVIIHHFFTQTKTVTDADILEKVKRTLPADRSHDWYAALMDYGSHLKALYGNNTRNVAGYTKQSKFKGSDREVRAAIVRALTTGSKTDQQMRDALSEYDSSKITPQIKNLLTEAMIEYKDDEYSLP